MIDVGYDAEEVQDDQLRVELGKNRRCPAMSMVAVPEEYIPKIPGSISLVLKHLFLVSATNVWTVYHKAMYADRPRPTIAVLIPMVVRELVDDGALTRETPGFSTMYRRFWTSARATDCPIARDILQAMFRR